MGAVSKNLKRVVEGIGQANPQAGGIAGLMSASRTPSGTFGSIAKAVAAAQQAQQPAKEVKDIGKAQAEALLANTVAQVNPNLSSLDTVQKALSTDDDLVSSILSQPPAQPMQPMPQAQQPDVAAAIQAMRNRGMFGAKSKGFGGALQRAVNNIGQPVQPQANGIAGLLQKVASNVAQPQAQMSMPQQPTNQTGDVIDVLQQIAGQVAQPQAQMPMPQQQQPNISELLQSMRNRGMFGGRRSPFLGSIRNLADMLSAQQQPQAQPQQFMAGGPVRSYAGGRAVMGDSDGMADMVQANIDGVEPVRIADGEYIIPADVVSGLGNGNTSAGVKHLDRMLDEVRMARTGTKRQGKQIDPRKHLPTGGYNGR